MTSLQEVPAAESYSVKLRGAKGVGVGVGGGLQRFSMIQMKRVGKDRRRRSCLHRACVRVNCRNKEIIGRVLH